jgi:hypothetical protein
VRLSRPDYRNCRKRNTNCSFRVFDPAPRLSPLSTSTADKLSLQVHVFPQIPEITLHGLHLKGLCDSNVQDALVAKLPVAARSNLDGILQHFAVATIPTICSGVPSQTAWRETLPSLAAIYTFVTHGMLAAASLHLAHLASTS